MNEAKTIDWPNDSICLRPAKIDIESVARSVYMRTCRTSFDQPGFCVLNAGNELDSSAFRQLMIDLKDAMSLIHQTETGRTLHYLSATRFDQQTSTKLHLDGGPEECFLMLGYELSLIHI